MTPEENLLISAMEECAEVAQRISKAIRFGLDEIQPGQPLTNRERIVEEFSQLTAKLAMALGMYNPDKINVPIEGGEYHKTPAKVWKYAELSRESGRLHLPPEEYEKRIRAALLDPGQFCKRRAPAGQRYFESLSEWQERAQRIALDNFPLPGTLPKGEAKP